MKKQVNGGTFSVRGFKICTQPPNIIRQNKSRRTKWTEHVACMGEERKACKTLEGKCEGKRQLGRLKRRWEDGIRMGLRVIGW
jgi:hypothetical protein